MPIRNYDITDEAGLRSAHPNLFKSVPDYRAIDNARKARFDLSPWVSDKADVAPVQTSVAAVEAAPTETQVHLEEAIASTIVENQVAAASVAPAATAEADAYANIPGWMQGDE